MDHLDDFEPSPEDLEDDEIADSRALKRLQAEILKLPPLEQRQLFQRLRSQLFPRGDEAQRRMKEVRERRFDQGLVCPHCQGKAVRHGTYGVKQRYRCKECSRTFGDFTLSPLYRARRPELWPAFIEHFFHGHSLRKSAELLGLKSHVPLFYWRHKLLAALRQLTPENFAGILETDETYLLYSQKGVRNLPRPGRKRGDKATTRGISREQACILVARDRQRHTRLNVACRGQMSRAKAKEILGAALSEVTTICSDKTAAFRALAKEQKLEHVILTGVRRERVKGGIYHIQNANALHSRFKTWVRRFNGVATKYLDHYLAWFQFVETHTMQALRGKTMELLVSACLVPLRTTCEGFRLAPCPFASPEEDPRHLSRSLMDRLSRYAPHERRQDEGKTKSA
jgi:transposase-like protein